ncbi:MAG: aminopeptidase P family protein [Clostridiales bacterium]|nr:aminopeptidase P family protein [Clostridiales bacterium]
MAIVKTQEEIAALKRAAKATGKAFVHALPLIRAGVTERQIADAMEEYSLWLPGVEGLAFPAIVASGPNGAQPHAELTDRVLEDGDLVTIDFGVMFRGYASDMTRTFMIGAPAETQKNIYESVRRAQAAGVAAAKAGVSCAEVDAVCRNLITDDGFGEYFIHTTGHGVGAEVHEDPRLAAASEAVLEAGMVVTIEPGIYIEGLGGVRIEDTVVITEKGCTVITPGIPKGIDSLKNP